MFDFNFDWRDDLNTNIEIVDFQHKQLYEIGRDIEQLLRTECIGMTDEQLLKIVCALRDYVAYHFYEEESLMQQAGYEGLEVHRQYHLKATKDIQAIDFREMKENPNEGLKKLKEIIQDWTFEHMLKDDIKMAAAIKDTLSQENGKQSENSKKRTQQYILEAVVDSIDSAVRVVEAGADRIELCSNMIIGGTTPTLALYNEVRRRCDTKIDVVIRPRCGDYHYTDTEFQLMLAEIKAFKAAGADGITIGSLDTNGDLDYPQMQRMILTAGKMQVTLNRAFDVCKDPFQTLKEAKELSIKNIITSGQKATCLEGIDTIKKLVAEGKDKINIIVSCGLNGSVMKQMHEETGATAYRVSGMYERESVMLHRNTEVHTGMQEFNEYIVLDSDDKRIRDAAEILVRL